MDKVNIRKEIAAELRTTWAGSVLIDEIQLTEMRAILSEGLAGGLTRKELAAQIGLTPYGLRRFLNGGDPCDSDWDAIGDWCDGRESPMVSPYLVALSCLCHWFPAIKVAMARGQVWVTGGRRHARLRRRGSGATATPLLRVPAPRAFGSQPPTLRGQ